MAESPDHADGKKTDRFNNKVASDPSVTPEAGASAAASDDLHKNLPMVLSPKLGAGEDETVEEPTEQPAEEAATAEPSPTQSSRFLVLAATVAFIAAFSSFVGSVSGAGFAHFYYPTIAAAPVAQT